MLSHEAQNILFLLKHDELVIESNNFDIDALAFCEKRKVEEYLNELIEKGFIKSFSRVINYNIVNRPDKIIYKVVKNESKY